MEEKQKKEVNVKEEKQAMGIIWLVGILVILLVCSIAYSISLRNKIVQEQQAKVENQNSENIEQNKNDSDINTEVEMIEENEVTNNNKNILTETEAKKMLKEKFEKTAKLFSEGYQNKEFKTKEVNGESDLIEITNFEEVLKKYFTNDVIKDYKKNAFAIYAEKDKVYFDSMIGSPDYYTLKNVTFKNIKITEDTILATANSTYKAAWDSSEVKKYSDTFKIVKKDGKWLVAKYTSHDVYKP